MANDIYIGINGGATRTTLVAVTPDLTQLAKVESGPTNYHNIGLAATRANLSEGLSQLAQTLNMPMGSFAGIGAGLAGVDRPEDQALIREVFRSIVPNMPLVVENDAIPALMAGAGERYGVITISGTGSITYGVNRAGDLLRCGGWGYFLDEGSGYDIAREAIRAVADATDEAAPTTLLTERLLARLNLPNPQALIPWLYAPERTVTEVAGAAAEAVMLIDDDLTARRIIVQAADRLAKAAMTVARRLDFEVSAFPVVMSGGLFDNCELLRLRFAYTVRTLYPRAEIIHAARSAAVGAAMLVLAKEGLSAKFEMGGIPVVVADRRATEQRSILTMHAGSRPTLELLSTMNWEDSRIGAILAPQLPQLAALIDEAAPRFKQGGRVIMAGAGTSGRLAVLDAVECRPTFGVTPEQVMGILAGGNDAMMNSIEGAEDDEAEGRAQIAGRDVGDLDTVIGVAASGSTPFVIGILKEAAERGALTGSITNVVDAPISRLAQYPLVAATGPEVLTGSTRLRAGTAQKLLLNMLTTGIMVRAGRTLDNLMIDMAASNLKLNHRAKVIVQDATGLSIEQAAILLAEADGNIRHAIESGLTKG